MKKQILFVEDDSDMLEVVSEFMQFEDYQVITNSGKSLDKMLQQHAVSLILLDENLNWGWGSDLCRNPHESLPSHVAFGCRPILPWAGLFPRAILLSPFHSVTFIQTFTP